MFSSGKTLCRKICISLYIKTSKHFNYKQYICLVLMPDRNMNRTLRDITDSVAIANGLRDSF